MRKKFSKKYLTEELNLPLSALEDDIIDTSRWSIQHKIVFKDDGKYWMTWYSVGSTEEQDEEPWDYDDEIECMQVEKKLVQVEQWVGVK